MASFKKYVRGTRSQLEDGLPVKGMLYTDSPIAGAFCKEMVNLDVSSDGRSITPRPGFVFSRKGKVFNAGLFTELEDPPQHIVASCSIVETASNKEWSYIYTHKLNENPNTEHVANGCVSGPLYVIKDQMVADLYMENLADGINSFTHFRKNDNNNVHKMKLEASPYTYKHIGTFAWNNSYFYTKTTKVGEEYTDKLMQGATSEKPYNGVLIHTQSPAGDSGIYADGTITLTINGESKTITVTTAGLTYMQICEQIASKIKALTFTNLFVKEASETSVTFEHKIAGEKIEVSGLSELKTLTTVGTTNALIFVEFYEDNFREKEVTPYIPTPKEAAVNGYNMLSDTPYAFEDKTADASPVSILGIVPYADESLSEAIIRPKLNQTAYFRVFYGRGTNVSGVKYKIEWKNSTATTWDVIIDKTTTGTAAPIVFPFNIPSYSFLLRVTVYNSADDTQLQVMPVSFNFTEDTDGLSMQKYNIKLAKGMTYWRNRLVLYNTPEDAKLLFLSAPNNPEYFPYPNNTLTFEEDIVHVCPLLDSLIVFTTSKVYTVVLAEDGLGTYTKCIQQNLHIAEADAVFIQTVKNMVFFKSGNYFYMIVPSAKSMTGELVIAPISKNIALFLDDFENNIMRILETVYDFKINENIIVGESNRPKLVSCYNHLDYEDIVNTYVFKMQDGRLMNFCLLYNITTRYWRVHIIESSDLTYAHTLDATKRAKYVTLYQKDNQITVVYSEYDKSTARDTYNPSQSVSPKPNKILFRNYQYLDTGFKEHNTSIKKRYRELQFKINNVSKEPLDFYTMFYIDHELRKDYKDYEIQYITNTEGITEVQYKGVPTIASSIVGNTLLGSWRLGYETFPGTSMTKVRLPVSGKGFCPRATILSKSRVPFELLQLTYVSRELNSR